MDFLRQICLNPSVPSPIDAHNQGRRQHLREAHGEVPPLSPFLSPGPPTSFSIQGRAAVLYRPYLTSVRKLRLSLSVLDADV